MKKTIAVTAMAVMLWLGMGQAHAISKSQLVGDWKCTSHFVLDDGGTETTVTLDSMKADGSMTQLWELVTRDKRGNLLGIDHFDITNRWSIKGDKLRIYDFNIANYVSYDKHKMPYEEESRLYFYEQWQDSLAEPYDSKIKFTNKDTFIFPQEDGTSNTTCVRLKPEAKEQS